MLDIGFVEVHRRRCKTVSDRFDAKERFDKTRSSDHVAGHTLRRRYRQCIRVIAESALYHFRFRFVVRLRRRTVRVVILNRRWLHTRVGKSAFDAKRSPRTVGSRCGYVISVARRSVARDFRIDARTALFGVFEFFEHEGGAPFGHDKAVSRFIERAARFFRTIVERRRKRLQHLKAADAESRNARFRAASDAHVDPAASNQIGGKTDRIGT